MDGAVFVELGPVAAELEVVAGLLATPPPVAALQRGVAEQVRALVQRIAALPRTTVDAGDTGWMACCEGQGVEVFREGTMISGMLGPSGELLWLDAHVDPEVHWHVTFEGTFSGGGALEALAGTAGSGVAETTRMTVDVTTGQGLVTSTRHTVDGLEVDCLDADSGIEKALEHFRNSLGHLSGAGDGEVPLEGIGEAAPGPIGTGIGSPPGDGMPGGAMAGAALGAAAAGVAGMAAAALRRRGRDAPAPPAGAAARPAAPARVWYYSAGGQSRGPCSLEDLKRFLGAGTITLRTPVWSPNLGDWRPASAVPALASTPAGPGGAVPPPLPSPAEWYFAVKGERKGPVTLAELRAHLGSGTIPRETLVWKPGMDGWVPASSLSELSS